MFLSAVSLALVVAGASDFQVGRLSAREQQIWSRMSPAIITLQQGDRPVGPAALIDAGGLFIAHRNAVLGDSVIGRTMTGNTVHLEVKGQDEVSQLVLLVATNWNQPNAQPFRAPDGQEQPGGTLLAVLPGGPIRAEFITNRRVGVLQPSRRLVPLNEFRFEAPAQAVGTALVLSETGEFLGALHATLTPAEDIGEASQSKLLGFTGLTKTVQQFGPGEMTVAYTAGAPIVRRVLNGFKSPSKTVSYPALGVMCNDAVGGGATVQQVTPGSPAAEAGMKVGDVMLDIQGRIVRNQIDFATIMLDQEIGSKITIRVRRGSQIKLLDAIVGKSSE